MNGERTSPESDRKTAILIAGMHRSGTSALTRTLGHLGATLPRTLLPPGPGNESGHWESQAIISLNDQLLQAFGSHWADWRAIDKSQRPTPEMKAFHQRAMEVLLEEFGDLGLWVIKDPRLCRLLPFWTDALQQVGIASAMVVPVRNPVDVAGSLSDRDGFRTGLGHLLWLRHVLDAEADSRNFPRVFVSFNALLDNWQLAAERISAGIGLVWPQPLKAASLQISDFLQPEHRHHNLPDDALLNSDVATWITNTFEILDRWTRDDFQDQDHSHLDQTRAAFDSASTLFGPVLAENTTQIAELEDTIADQERKIAIRDQKITERDLQVAERDQRVADRDQFIDAMSRSVSWRTTTPLRWIGDRFKRSK